jgi:arginine/lysine/ornithine decarboxylase
MVFRCTDFGYTGSEFCDLLRNFGIECEFSDDTYAVLMITPSNTPVDLDKLKTALASVTPRTPLCAPVDTPEPSERVMSIRGAVLAPHELIPVDNALGRVAGAPTVSCPPAIPIVVSGERITDTAIALFKRYGIEKIEVVKNA